LVISIKKRLPKWIPDSNTEDDITKESIVGKTYNLKPLIEGVNDAYSKVSKSDSYLTLNVQVMQKSDSNFGKTILILFILAIMVAVPTMIIINRKKN